MKMPQSRHAVARSWTAVERRSGSFEIRAEKSMTGSDLEGTTLRLEESNETLKESAATDAILLFLSGKWVIRVQNGSCGGVYIVLS